VDTGPRSTRSLVIRSLRTLTLIEKKGLAMYIDPFFAATSDEMKIKCSRDDDQGIDIQAFSKSYAGAGATLCYTGHSGYSANTNTGRGSGP
jgi:hypothetical protein